MGPFLTFGDNRPARPLNVAVAVEPPRPEDAAEFARKRLGFEPDPLQERVLLSEAKLGILNCSRQWGKSTTTAAKAVHRAFTRPGSVVLVASPTLRQSGEFMKKASDMLRRMKITPRGDGINKCSLLLPNNSRIVGLPGGDANLRGFSSVSMLMIDEAARVDDETYHALTPMLAVGNGDVWVMSTPVGKRGFFYHIWEFGGEEWDRIRVPATECPRIPAAFLEAERSRKGDARFRREYMCEFVDRGAGIFDRDLIERALRESVKPLNLGWRLSNF